MWRGRGNGCERGDLLCPRWVASYGLASRACGYPTGPQAGDRLRRIDRTDRALKQCPSPNVSADKTISSSLAAAFYIYALHLVCVLHRSPQPEHTQEQLSPSRVAASHSSFKWRNKWCADKNRPEGRKEAAGSHWYENR